MNATAGTASDDLPKVVAALDLQIGWCRALGSPFTADMIEVIRENVVSGGSLAAIALPWPGDPTADVLALRLAGVLHMMVRTHRASGLKPYYPPRADRTWDKGAVTREVETAIAANADYVRAFISSPPQTNEIGRSAILMPGYVEIARRTGLPLNILEVGASAGLNMLWDRFAYRLGEHRVGSEAPVTINAQWTGNWPNIETLPRVVARHGCDRSPINLADHDAADRLVSYVWPDQVDRMTRLENAIALARVVKPPIEKADAAEWLERKLAEPNEGAATVIAHTIVWTYFAKETASRARAAIENAGKRATKHAPIAWLAFEHIVMNEPPVLKLTLWPSGEETILARAHPHGATVHWLL